MYKIISSIVLTILLFATISCNSNETGHEDTTNTDSTSTTQINPTNTESSTSEINVSSFMELDIDMHIGDYVGQKVWIQGTITPPEKMMEHMMKGSNPMAEELNVCIDFNEGEQIIGYYSGINVPRDNQSHKFYGTVDKISGAGKGGENHTEYFINLDKVE